MRMTNKIMQNNSLYNINQNKVLQDKLSTQMSTQKKLTRPSDDPVVAIRALRLRTSVSEINQYYEKNAPDAESWLKVTADGLGTVTDILTNLSTNANKGSNKDLTADDLDIIVTQMKSLSEEFYSTGNLDYAGRYVFTGYRTDTPTSFTATDVADGTIPKYTITEQLDKTKFDVINFTDTGNVSGANATNYMSHTDVETNISNSDIHRLRLAYGKLDNLAAGESLSITKSDYVVDPETGDKNLVTTPLISASAAVDAEDAYKKIALANENKTSEAYFIPETGELVFSDEAFKLMDTALTDESEIRVAYTKSEWVNGDLRPEHYFYCEADGVEYNKDYISKKYAEKTQQTIEYDVGYNQTIRVNTTADEVFDHNLKRDIDDLQKALDDLKSISSSKTAIQGVFDKMETSDSDYVTVKNQLDAINKAYDYVRDNMHTLMEGAITKMQKYLDATNVAVTDNGTRSSRLNLISNRLMEQETTFETLRSENEDVDIADVAINLSSAELTYEASLTATAKIMQTSLMNYI